MRLDFTTCDNAQPPHVKVLMNGDTLAIVPISDGNVSQAEGFAEAIVVALQDLWKVCKQA